MLTISQNQRDLSYKTGLGARLNRRRYLAQFLVKHPYELTTKCVTIKTLLLNLLNWTRLAGQRLRLYTRGHQRERKIYKKEIIIIYNNNTGEKDILLALMRYACRSWERLTASPRSSSEVPEVPARSRHARDPSVDPPTTKLSAVHSSVGQGGRRHYVTIGRRQVTSTACQPPDYQAL